MHVHISCVGINNQHKLNKAHSGTWTKVKRFLQFMILNLCISLGPHSRSGHTFGGVLKASLLVVSRAAHGQEARGCDRASLPDRHPGGGRRLLTYATSGPQSARPQTYGGARCRQLQVLSFFRLTWANTENGGGVSSGARRAADQPRVCRAPVCTDTAVLPGGGLSRHPLSLRVEPQSPPRCTPCDAGLFLGPTC